MSNTKSSSRRAITAVLLDYGGLVAVLVGLVFIFSLITTHFYSAMTFRTIANQIPDAIIIATGMTFVLIIAGIDLSVGSVLGLSSAVLGICLLQLGWPFYLAVPAALAAGALCGGINGFISVHWRIPSFIVTLGMLEAARGAAYLTTQSQTQYIGARVEWIAEANLFGLSLPFLLAVLIVILAQIVLSTTVFGRHIFAIGANEEAARLSGINTPRLKMIVFLLAGALAGLAGVVHCARLGSADPNAGIGYELYAIAAVVIGGTSLMGGRGSVIRSFLGVVIITVLETGLAQAGAQDPTKRLVTGCVIVAAVIIDVYRHQLRGSAHADP